MFKVIGTGFLIISGLCLTAIMLRKKTRLFGTLTSTAYNEKIDSIDKYLSLTALIFLILAIIFLVLLI